MSKNLFLSFEIIWWSISILVAIGVLLPIYTGTNDYPFYFINALYIVAFITITRYIFFLKYTFLAQRLVWKLIVMFLSIPFVFYLVQELNYFQTYLDENGPEAVIGNIPLTRQKRMIQYVYNEMLLFGVGSIISAVIFPFRLLLSIWRIYNQYDD